VQLFTGGLLPPLSLVVQVQDPQSLAAAMSLARQMELMEQYATSTPKTAPHAIQPTPGPCPAQGVLPGTKTATPVATVEGRPIKRLTQAEQEERCRLGLCYNCDERFTRATTLSNDTEAPVFSLHAVVGVPICDTMQVRASVGG